MRCDEWMMMNDIIIFFFQLLLKNVIYVIIIINYYCFTFFLSGSFSSPSVGGWRDFIKDDDEDDTVTFPLVLFIALLDMFVLFSCFDNGEGW